jgi:hypothetical protein
VTTVPQALPGAGRVTQLRVARSEWTKLRSVRSTRWALLAAVVFTIGIGAIASAVVAHQWPTMSASDRAGIHPLDPILPGVQLAQLAIGVLGVLVISAEYSTGMIRASLTAVPKRLPVLWAKAAVYGLVTLVLMTATVFVTFFVGQALLSGRIDVSLSAPGVLRAVFGAALYLTVVAIFGVGLGAIIRNTAGGVAAFAGIMFVLPPLFAVLPASWGDAAVPYLPLIAGQAVMSVHHGDQSLSAWPGFAVLCGYALAALALGAISLLRRDA